MKNIGQTDKIIRFVLGVFVLSLIFWGPQTYWGLIGLVLIGTGFVKYCPLYSVFGIKTCANKS